MESFRDVEFLKSLLLSLASMYGTHLIAPSDRGLATFGKPEQPLERVGEPSGGGFGRTVFDK